MSETEKSDATVFFTDELIHEFKKVLKKPPVKKDMVAYISSWLNTLETIKSLNEAN